MIGRICLLLEALSIVICLHHLYGKKFKLDIATISLLAIDMIMMTTIDYFGWPSTLSIIIYPIIAIYCGIEFGFEFKKIIINNVLYMVFVSGSQLVAMVVYCYLFNVHYVNNYDLLIVNIIALFIVSIVFSKCKLSKISHYLQDRERILIVALCVSVCVAIFCLIKFKVINIFELSHSVLLFVSVIFICILASQLSKYRIKARESETELRMYRLYEDSFKQLVEDIRIRQHEFDNHISTIYSQHLISQTYEELVERQKEYCHELEKDNRYNKLLKSNNHMIRGFLYSKFLKIDQLGIKVSYEIAINELNIKLPVYKLVEVLGDLINNAVEAMLEEKYEKRLHVSIVEMESGVEIEVKNTSVFIPHKNIAKFFMKGYSEKGNNRGLGLYNVKKICDEYEFNIKCNNIMLDDLNWLSFKLTNTK